MYKLVCIILLCLLPVGAFMVKGYRLAIATFFTADRLGNIYKQAVMPDMELVEGDNFLQLLQDEKVLAAIQWLTAQKNNSNLF
jgi:hypothetical protein